MQQIVLSPELRQQIARSLSTRECLLFLQAPAIRICSQHTHCLVSPATPRHMGTILLCSHQLQMISKRRTTHMSLSTRLHLLIQLHPPIHPPCCPQILSRHTPLQVHHRPQAHWGIPMHKGRTCSRCHPMDTAQPALFKKLWASSHLVNSSTGLRLHMALVWHTSSPQMLPILHSTIPHMSSKTPLQDACSQAWDPSISKVHQAILSKHKAMGSKPHLMVWPLLRCRRSLSIDHSSNLSMECNSSLTQAGGVSVWVGLDRQGLKDSSRG